MKKNIDNDNDNYSNSNVNNKNNDKFEMQPRANIVPQDTKYNNICVGVDARVVQNIFSHGDIIHTIPSRSSFLSTHYFRYVF